MARPPTTAGGRPIVVAVRLSPSEAALLDRCRGALSRSLYLRELLARTSTNDRSR